MKTIKLSIIFLTIVNCVFLALNVYYYGMKSGSEEPNDDCIVGSEKENVSEDCMVVETEELDVDNNAGTFTPTPTANAYSLRLALIRYVGNRPTLKQYQQHGGYKHFNKKEKYAIEAYLNPGQYENKLNSIGKKALHEITDRTYEFNSMKDIYEVQKRISKVIEEKNYKMENAQ